MAAYPNIRTLYSEFILTVKCDVQIRRELFFILMCQHLYLGGGGLWNVLIRFYNN